ncbi:MAG: PilZ domain-containing protein [Candidatus Eremiobacteraeota bacterium]|nr:PilZ domain-containing protein [Candidatus Eremiobacteraeota bacterium]
MNLINIFKELTGGAPSFKEALREKRGIPRISCSINARARLNDRNRHFTITNLSLNGIRMESPIRLSTGLTFPLSVDAGAAALENSSFEYTTLRVKVVWCRKKRYSPLFIAGLSFTDREDILERSWVHYVFHRMGFDPESIFMPRGNLRIFSSFPVSCIGDNKVSDGIIINIGLGGLLMESTVDFSPQASVTLAIGPYKGFRKLTAGGKVIRSTPLEKKKEKLVAIEFETMPPREYKELGRLLLALLSEDVF